MDTPDDDLTVPEGTDPDGFDAELDPAYDTGEAAGTPATRWLLAALAGLAVVALGIVLWGVLNAQFTREFAGASVVIGLAVGYVVREVSRRSDLPARVVAVVLTAVACVAGTVVGDAAYAATQLPKFVRKGFWDLLGDYLPDTFDKVAHRTWVQFLIYGVALVIAYLAAGPAKPKAVVADEDDEDDTADETAEPAAEE